MIGVANRENGWAVGGRPVNFARGCEADFMENSRQVARRGGRPFRFPESSRDAKRRVSGGVSEAGGLTAHSRDRRSLGGVLSLMGFCSRPLRHVLGDLLAS